MGKLYIVCLWFFVYLWFQEVFILIYLKAYLFTPEGLLIHSSAVWYLISLKKESTA